MEIHRVGRNQLKNDSMPFPCMITQLYRNVEVNMSSDEDRQAKIDLTSVDDEDAKQGEDVAEEDENDEIPDEDNPNLHDLTLIIARIKMNMGIIGERYVDVYTWNSSKCQLLTKVLKEMAK
ncbi:hypothetical protein LWI28_002887 [Acer negundo]|uniref:Uncharacterized protein n=1 Tax=Acer negundo TaxID=4023 RepID=A0AAD5IPS0_ACENE|nr:hypothetical protein LWI28_002887 [Acer negundo]